MAAEIWRLWRLSGAGGPPCQQSESTCIDGSYRPVIQLGWNSLVVAYSPIPYGPVGEPRRGGVAGEPGRLPERHRIAWCQQASTSRAGQVNGAGEVPAFTLLLEA